MNTWAVWLAGASAGASVRSIASQTGLPRSSISRWFLGSRPPIEAVLTVVHVYDASALDGLLAAGYLSEQDVADIVGRALLSIPTRVLIDELHARGSRSSERGFYDPPTDPTEWPPRD